MPIKESSGQLATKFLRKLLEDSGEDEIGLSDFIPGLAKEMKTTFEKARNCFYDALDDKTIELTPQYKVRLAV